MSLGIYACFVVIKSVVGLFLRVQWFIVNVDGMGCAFNR